MSLRLKNISLPLADFVLEVDVEMHGRVTAVFGPSGAGKTSLLDLIAGLRVARSAFIQLDGSVLTDTAKKFSRATHRRGIGYVPQDLALFPHLSVRQNLFYGRKAREADGPSVSFEHVLKVLEIEPLISRGVTELSGGEKQRVALARALLASPRLLLLDEPLASLDVPLREKIIPYLGRVRDEFQIPMLCVTHDRFVALTLADEIVVLMGGKIMQTGPVSDVFNFPANAEVARFVGVETLQPGRITGVNEGLATVTINRVTLTALAPATPADAVFICIRGEDVVLQRDVAVSSVRNRLPARIIAIRPEGALFRVELDAGFTLFALVTRPACDELGLREGDSITALIKTPAIHLVPR
ncbi:MAG TPA: molybdenum ABC transporter ATP-binding protein [Candidatus Acidoferrales bacterium]|nr:molybdenum ABC transporter ATP-binding protein [Candidatus Acidoferrales bacterium]